MVASVGLDIIGKNLTSRRDALIVASSLAVGLGILAAPPAAFDVVAPAVRILVTDGIVMGILLAMILNIVLPKPVEARIAPAH
jgi:NCS2 family nucleobase:cation symporter-2